MDRDVDDASGEDAMEARAMHAFQSLDVIERATMNGCSPRALQDIVGNLLVMLAWIEDGRADDGRSSPRAIDPRVRSLIADCLARAGVPVRALPDSIGLIRDCLADIEVPPAPPNTAGATRPMAD